MQLLITGAEQGEDGKGNLALALILDLDSGQIVHRAEYTTPDHLRTPEHKVQFTGNCFIDARWFVCSHNEILEFDHWPPCEPSNKLSIPGFNDLHHCIPWQGHLAVSNTGLETVDIVSLEGELVERFDLIPSERDIDPDKDYRLIADTKPHVRHGNHLFEHNGALWTSQLRTMNAVCVMDQSAQLDIEVGMPHDGDWIDGGVFFTTTNGHIVEFPGGQQSKRKTYSLKEMTPELDQLGWCRGVCAVPDAPGHYFIMFSALRRSKWKDFGYFIKYGHSMPQSRVARYNLAAGKLIETWSLGDGKGYQVFQVSVLNKDQQI